MQVDCGGGGIERLHTLREEASDHTSQHIACTSGGEGWCTPPVNTSTTGGFRNNSASPFEYNIHLPFFSLLSSQFQTINTATRDFAAIAEATHFNRMWCNHCAFWQ